MIRQGIRNEYIWVAIIVCIFGEILLTALGVFGLGTIFAQFIWLKLLLGFAGIIYLLKFAFESFRDALAPTTLILKKVQQKSSLKAVFLSACAVTFFNPWAFTDTLVIIGSLAAQYNWLEKTGLASGSVFIATLFFLLFGYSGKLARRIFQNPKAVRVLDFTVGTIMSLIACGLLWALSQDLWHWLS